MRFGAWPDLTALKQDLRAGLFNLNSENVQRRGIAPISLKLDWQDWVPEVRGNGAMTVTLNNVLYARYLELDTIVMFALHISFTIGGTPNSRVLIEMPVPIDDTNSGSFAGGCRVRNDQTYELGGWISSSQSEITVFRGTDQDPAVPVNWNAGGNEQITAQGFYFPLET